MIISRTIQWVWASLAFAWASVAWGQHIMETARNIPVAYDVDVVVVGGTSGGVAAAVAAAEDGARVFLISSRPYLGEDLCATWRIWLDSGEEPKDELAKALFAKPSALMPLIGKGLKFTYETSIPSGGVHKDTDPPSRLADGVWRNAVQESVEYKGDVTITADLGHEQPIGRVCLVAFQRPRDFAVESVAVSVSGDKQQWREAATIANDRIAQGEFVDTAIPMNASVNVQARYVRFDVRKHPSAGRVLLGEIAIEPPGAASTPPDGVRIPPTPMQIKSTLDEALIRADVKFLHGGYATDVLRDADGRLAGIVMANRSGRQAVRAKIIVDATPRATVARLAGCAFEAYPPGPQEFTRVTIGAPLREGIAARVLPAPLRTATPAKDQPSEFPAVEYTLSLVMRDGSFASFAEAEQQARDVTWDCQQAGASESLFQIPPDSMHGRKRLDGTWPGAERADLDAFRPEHEDRIYVLGGCADVSREAAGALLRPLAFLAIGRRIGHAAAEDAKAAPAVHHARVPAVKGKRTVAGNVQEVLTGIRSFDTGLDTIKCGARPLPVLGSYDVVVVGGGTGGAPAGISAARQGAKTLVVEYLHGLGGVGTLGLIGNYYFGYRGGFTNEVDRGVAAMDGLERAITSSWNVEWKMEWYRRELRKAGADIWFGSLCCGVLREGNRVTGVVVATPDGRGVVLAKAVIDATGNADVAAAAGAPCVATNAEDIAVQGTGMPPREPGAHYTNTDYTMTDDSDVVDAWRTLVSARRKYRTAFDLAQIVDSRERRRIVGDFTISPLDIWNKRTYPDSIGYSESNFDTHGYTVHPFFALWPPDKERVSAYTPYRSLLPKGLDGILVIGLGISAHRDAMPILRMQPDIQNQGYAAGLAAAMAAKAGTGTRAVDIKAVQRILVEKGNLPASVLTDKDSYPFPHERIVAAVASLRNDYDGVAAVLAFPNEALPLLRKAYQSATPDKEKLIYAHVLGMLGDAAGAPTLVQAVAAAAWDKGWSFTGMGQFGGSVSHVDSLIIALGRTRKTEGLAPILEKAATLNAGSEFSHFRAIALALETLKDPKAAPALAELLAKPGMSGFACLDIESAGKIAELANPNLDRDRSLRELILARALYRCGDRDGMGKRILEQYAADLRGHFARHAHGVLSE